MLIKHQALKNIRKISVGNLKSWCDALSEKISLFASKTRLEQASFANEVRRTFSHHNLKKALMTSLAN